MSSKVGRLRLPQDQDLTKHENAFHRSVVTSATVQLRICSLRLLHVRATRTNSARR